MLCNTMLMPSSVVGGEVTGVLALAGGGAGGVGVAGGGGVAEGMSGREADSGVLGDSLRRVGNEEDELSRGRRGVVVL